MKLHHWTAIILVGLGVAAPAYATVDEHLAKKCQEMALAAHPASLPDIPAVANLRHSYYSLCISRRGQMDPELTNPLPLDFLRPRNEAASSFVTRK